MKVRVTLKDPDTMPDAVCDAVHKLQAPNGISDKEWASIKNERICAEQSKITTKWMDWGEYLVVEFDTDEGTATVLPCGKNGL